MMIRAYLDNNATTRPYDAVLKAQLLVQQELYLNASSLAGELLGAARPLAEARMAMLNLLGGDAEDRLVLTSGASEANAWAVFGATSSGSHIVTTAVEHRSILAASEAARARGLTVALVGVDANGLISPDTLAASLRPDTQLVSIQLANNETGVIQPLGSLAAMIRKNAPGALIHCDATQAVARITIDLSDMLAEIDLLSFSAHKFHGPKGIGGLFIRDGVELTPLIAGEQEGGLRGGTSNAPGAAGLAVAARQAQANLKAMAAVAELRDELESRLLALYPGAQINGAGAPRLPNTSSVLFPGALAEDLVEALALQGICVATGSACTAGATAPSHVLTAMGLAPADARATLRFSLSVETQHQEIDLTLAALAPLLKFAG
ncbi:MAG: cysteine desulfurase family protein [Pigmentiphaga sp.]|jgi:cysteine desulfurase